MYQSQNRKEHDWVTLLVFELFDFLRVPEERLTEFIILYESTLFGFRYNLLPKCIGEPPFIVTSLIAFTTLLIPPIIGPEPRARQISGLMIENHPFWEL